MNASADGAVGQAVDLLRLMHEDPAVFMSMLKDERGDHLAVEPFHEEWLRLFHENDRVAILAPRGHGKTTTVIAHLLWHCWRHNRHPDTGLLHPDLPGGTWEAFIFSARLEQATHEFEAFQSLMLANEHLFADILPVTGASGRATVRDVWSRRMTRLKNRAQVSIRAYSTAVRGLHPDLLLLDDVLCDENSLSSHQRDQTWRWFSGTILPMNPTKLIVIGTAFHRGDLLHRLKPRDGTEATSGDSKVRFTWRKYAAIDTEHETALWQSRHPYEELLERRSFDPVSFAREYMNEPTDDASSMFPFDLTERMVDPTAVFTTSDLRPGLRGELIVFGYDLAASAEISADYCCLIVIAVDKRTYLRRRVLWAYREKGLGFDAQVELLRDVCRRFEVTIGVVETNGFQRWIRDACAEHPETAGRIFGHTTGRDKGSLEDGVPALKLGIVGGSWDGALPAGDDESAAFTGILRTEAAAFGWKDGRLQGVGEHDDTVMALYHANIAVRLVERYAPRKPEYEIVTLEDLGIEPVDLGDY